MALNILANDGMDRAAVAALESKGHVVDTAHYVDADLERHLKQSDVVVIRSETKIREPLINAVKGSRLKLIIRAGVGIDNIDHAYAEACGIAVRNTPNASSAAVAELAIGHMFALARHVYAANVTMRNGEWLKKQYSGIELSGKTLGLIGMGRIAHEVAVRAQALGMHVLYTNRKGDIHNGFEYVPMEVLLGRSDFISLHIPFNKAVGATLDAAAFSKMKDGVYIINTARGGVVSEAALLEALDSGKVAAAALDVFEAEPSQNLALISHPRVSVTPHIGASTREAQARIGLETLDVIDTFFE